MNSLFKTSCLAQPLYLQVRFGHRLRGKPAGVAKTLEQVLSPKIYDPELVKRHDIGLPHLKQSRSAELQSRLQWVKKQRSDQNVEKLAKSNKLIADLDEIQRDWLKTSGPLQIKKLCEHYGIFKDLFGDYAYFVPRIFLDIKYTSKDDLHPIFFGNRIRPSQVQEAPQVNFDPTLPIEEQTKIKPLWTLCLINPDGHLTENNKELVHWMVTNIPEGKCSEGQTIVPYLQPLPFKGTGYHRMIFILFKQDKKVDFSEYQVKDLKNLDSRTFTTFEFYKKHQDYITPAGVSFFQAKYDDSVREVFHKTLDRKQPIFEYDFPEFFLKKQKHFPLRESFNLYLDKYADPKDVNKRYLEDRLNKTNPFDGPPTPLNYPLAQYMENKNTPSWLRTEIRKQRRGLGRIQDVE